MVGIDLSERRPKKLSIQMQLHADWAITLACGGECPYVPATVEDWDIPDPAGKRSDGEIRACADAVLGGYDEVPVRSFVMSLAHRRSRECLAAEHCDALATTVNK